jgi:hypothetical protein
MDATGSVERSSRSAERPSASVQVRAGPRSRAHNPEVAGSNPAPATQETAGHKGSPEKSGGPFRREWQQNGSTRCTAFDPDVPALTGFNSARRSLGVVNIGCFELKIWEGRAGSGCRLLIAGLLDGAQIMGGLAAAGRRGGSV